MRFESTLPRAEHVTRSTELLSHPVRIIQSNVRVAPDDKLALWFLFYSLEIPGAMLRGNQIYLLETRRFDFLLAAVDL